jgi:uncharacterized Zn-binding protein involved in type VI secretion
MALSALVKNFVWSPITPETLHLPTLPTNLATTADVQAAKAQLEAELALQTADLGSRLLSAVDAEGLVNDAISASIETKASELLQIQNTVFATINGRIDNVATSVTNVADSVAVVSGNVALVDGKVAAVKGDVTAISTDLGVAKTTLANAVVSNTEQDNALEEILKGVKNLGEVATTLLSSPSIY